MTTPYKATPLPIVKFKDLMAKEIKIEWLNELMPLIASVLLAGDSGVGKTWMLLDLILAVATGGYWLEQFKCKQGPVLVFDEENADVLIQDRLRQLCIARKIAKLEDLPIYFSIGNAIDITPFRDSRTGEETPSPKFLDVLATAQQVKPVLITFDSFIRIHHANENTSNEMRAVTSQIARIAREQKATCVISHHFTKSGSTASGQRIRGTGDIRAFCDLALLVDECKDGVVITPDKERWTARHDPFAVKLSQDEETGAFTVAYNGAKSIIKKRTPWELICASLKNGTRTRAQIVEDATGFYSARRIDKELAYRIEQGDLSKDKSGYSLSADGFGDTRSDELILLQIAGNNGGETLHK